MRNVLTSKLPKKKEEEEEKYHLDYIGEDGYVYKHNGEKYYKTGIFLQGPKGQPGVKGKDGLIPRIGKNGNWFIGDTDTFVKAALDTSLYATKKDLDDLIDNAPEVLNTLKELANAIGDDADFATNINNRLTDIENVAYQVPVGGIPESDLSQGVKDKLNENEVFWATYGTTTAAEIDAAVAAGKEVLCLKDNTVYQLVINASNLTYIQFFSMLDTAVTYLRLKRSNNAWDATTTAFQKTSDKVSSWSATPNNTRYPSEKLVKDSLDTKADLSLMAKWGVVSQTQTWTQASDGGYDYTMSNLVYGWIPQANIDLYESAGATFNETSGYFELNGLTDISYEEMEKVYALSIGMVHIESNRSTQGVNYGARSTLPVRGTYSFQTNISYWFWSASNMEQIFIKDGNVIFTALKSSTDGAFQNCNKLKTITRYLKLTSTSAITNLFTGCKSLEKVYLNGLAANTSLSDSPRLSAESVAYMINNVGIPTITITLHPTAYARAIADSDVQAALQAHTNVSLASAT